MSVHDQHVPSLALPAMSPADALGPSSTVTRFRELAHLPTPLHKSSNLFQRLQPFRLHRHDHPPFPTSGSCLHRKTSVCCKMQLFWLLWLPEGESTEGSKNRFGHLIVAVQSRPVRGTKNGRAVGSGCRCSNSSNYFTVPLGTEGGKAQ